VVWQAVASKRRLAKLEQLMVILASTTEASEKVACLDSFPTATSAGPRWPCNTSPLVGGAASSETERVEHDSRQAQRLVKSGTSLFEPGPHRTSNMAPETAEELHDLFYRIHVCSHVCFPRLADKITMDNQLSRIADGAMEAAA